MGMAVKRIGKCSILPGTWEMELVANCIEDGMSLTLTTDFVNEYLVEEMGQPMVTRNAVYTAYKSLLPVETIVGTRNLIIATAHAIETQARPSSKPVPDGENGWHGGDACAVGGGAPEN